MSYILDGGAGTDLAVFFGSINDWQVSLNVAQEVVLFQQSAGGLPTR
ncbi:hypothetical protein [Azonexus sp.]|nr:hypothetical protein [Azonexus sp.]